MGLLIQSGDDLFISTFSNADWATNVDDKKFVVAYCVFLGNILVSWSLKKQTAIARSNIEFEYQALAHVAVEVIWLKQLLSELGVLIPTTPIIWCDNLNGGALATNMIFHARIEHIEIDVHFVCVQVLQDALRSLLHSLC